MTKKLKLDQLKELISDLQAGEVAAFPTDTVYGIGCICTKEAIEKMKWVKGRDENKPFPLMVYSIKEIKEYGYVNDNASKIINKFMPGALTIVLKKKECISSEITNGQSTIAIRIPNDEVLLSILKETKGLLVTSANLSGQPAGCSDYEVLKQLEGRINSILLGESQNKVASTIVDCSGEEIVVLRDGPITEAMLKECIK